MLPPNGWRPGSGKVGQGGLKVLHVWHHSQKTSNPQAKNFFSSADWKTCRVFWDFYRVCIAYWTREIPAQSHVSLGVFFLKIPESSWTPKSQCNVATFSLKVIMYTLKIWLNAVKAPNNLSLNLHMELSFSPTKQQVYCQFIIPETTHFV